MVRYGLMFDKQNDFIEITLETYEELMRKFGDMKSLKREIYNSSDHYFYYNTHYFLNEENEIVVALEKATLK